MTRGVASYCQSVRTFEGDALRHVEWLASGQLEGEETEDGESEKDGVTLDCAGRHRNCGARPVVMIC